MLDAFENKINLFTNSKVYLHVKVVLKPISRHTMFLRLTHNAFKYKQRKRYINDIVVVCLAFLCNNNLLISASTLVTHHCYGHCSA